MPTVLVVDDSTMMRTIIKDVIEADPEFRVIGTAKDGKEGIEKVASLKPDLVLLDIQMPVMNGLDALKRLKLLSKAKVIIISSIADIASPAALEARRLGAAEVIQKPSGAVSLDIQHKTGSEIVRAARVALDMPPFPEREKAGAHA